MPLCISARSLGPLRNAATVTSCKYFQDSDGQLEVRVGVPLALALAVPGLGASCAVTIQVCFELLTRTRASGGQPTSTISVGALGSAEYFFVAFKSRSCT
jgi:hypothetical protein